MSGGFGEYTFASGKVRPIYKIPAALNDPDVVALEQLRVKLGGEPPPFYIQVRVDNRLGSQEIISSDIQIVTSDGQSHAVDTGGGRIRFWASSVDDVSEARRYSKLADEQRFTGNFFPGQTGSAILVPLQTEFDVKNVLNGADVSLRRV